ncbi:MAG: chemotaxis protein CheW [Methylotenera sp.]|nr:chemotaxis protein CheW [Methylotenera sp.]
MAKTSNLREFQETILNRLKEVSATTGAASGSRLAVMVGSQRLLIDLVDVVEVLPVPPVLAVPHTQPWFLGVANVRGNLYNISDLVQFAGLPPQPRTANNRILLLNSDESTQSALVITSLIGLRNIQEMELKAVSDAQQQVFGHNFYEDAEKNQWVVFDVDALVKSPAFIQPNA